MDMGRCCDQPEPPPPLFRVTQSDPPQSGGAEPEPPPPVTSGRGAAAIDGRPLDVSGIKVLQDVWDPLSPLRCCSV